MTMLYSIHAFATKMQHGGTTFAVSLGQGLYKSYEF